jgi:mono/diheme cytochrome c family protein
MQNQHLPPYPCVLNEFGVLLQGESGVQMIAKSVLEAVARIAVASLSVGALLAAPPQSAANRPASSATPQRALLDKYCVICHNERAKTAGLLLDKMDLANVPAAAEVWEKVIRKLRVGAMPPVGMPKPDDHAVSSLVLYLETSLDRAAAANLNPGHATLHRLNRTEYANAVRDMLALDIDASGLLPPDDESYGFDNIADVLGVSPVLLERYVSASRKVSRWAVGDPSLGAVAQIFRTRPDLSQSQRVDGLPLGTRGGLAMHYNFPLDGKYNFKIVLARNTVDVIRGLEEAHQIEILVDGARIFLASVGGTADTEALVKNPAEAKLAIEARLQARVPVKAGPHTVGVTFLQRNAAEEDYILEPFLRTTLDPVNEAGLPHIEQVTISGPYDATGSGDTPSRRKIFTCTPANASQEVACAKRILSTLGRHAYRRPITDTDMETLLSFYQAGRNHGSFEAGIERALRLILSSPAFVFRFERDPVVVAPGSAYRISDLELASRLSFFLWSSIPDDELIDLAVQNKLHEPATLQQQVRRMLADTRSDSLSTNFAAQWLYLRNLKNFAPNPSDFPDFDDNLRRSLAEETELFFGNVVHSDRPVTDLLNADYTFVNERLARHYGIPNIYGPRFRRVTITDEARRGLLGQGSILTVTSYATRTSPVLRGKWILTNILGTPPPPAPPNVPALKENNEGGKVMSVRERLEEHRKNPACASCHKIMDPLGFALENFDAIGKWRIRSEDGAPIDASGVLLDGSKINGPVTLRAALMSRSDVFVSTLTEKLLTYALGRGIDYSDQPAVRAIVARAAADQYKFSDLVEGIVQSPPFRMKTKTTPETTSQPSKTVASAGSGQ